MIQNVQHLVLEKCSAAFRKWRSPSCAYSSFYTRGITLGESASTTESAVNCPLNGLHKLLDLRNVVVAASQKNALFRAYYSQIKNRSPKRNERAPAIRYPSRINPAVHKVDITVSAIPGISSPILS
jgi:hypothetical protein